MATQQSYFRMLNELDSLTTDSFKLEVNLSNSSEPPIDGWLFLGDVKKYPK